MIKNYIILILSLAAIKITSQTVYYPFPLDSAEWHVKLTCQQPFCTAQIHSPYQSQQKADTIINTKTYHKMYDKVSSALYCYYREALKKIYVKYPLGGIFGNDTAEFVLYDFNINIGDTFVVKVPSTWISASGPIPTQPKIVLTSTNTASAYPWYNLPNPTTRKVYFFNSNISCTSANIVWVEGIGTRSGFFYNLYFDAWSVCMTPPAPNSISLTCFFKNGNLVYSNGCTITNINSVMNSKNNISIFPNPTEGNFKLKLNTESDNKKQIEITNLLGELIFKKEIDQNEIQIDIANFSNGLYLLKIFDGNNIEINRLIKK